MSEKKRRRLNVRLLRRTLRHIEEHPETWDQATWCGTSMCFAGWACHLSGWRHDDYVSEMICEVTDEGPEWLVTDGYVVDSAADVAEVILGLEHTTYVNLLFRGSNKLSDLRTIVDRLVKDERNARDRERRAARKVGR